MLTVAQAPITTAAIDPNQPTPMIVTITGTPGDGNTALAAAIHGELARVGLPISDQGRRLKYRLDVHVTVGQWETTANSRSRSNGGCEIRKVKSRAPSRNALRFPMVSSMGHGGMTLPMLRTPRLKAYSGCYANRPLSDRGLVEDLSRG